LFGRLPGEVKSEFDMGVGKRKAVYKPFAQAAPNKVVIDKKGTSPCKFSCPAHMDAHGYIALAAQGRWEEALEVVRRVTPFAGVLGRVCFHPCENDCSRRFSEEPLAIAGIKRYVADRVKASGSRPPVKVSGEPKGKKVAVIGAGPSGLNCAYQLAREGYPVTVFERLPVGGGMLRVGIPDYRLDKEVLKDEISLIEEMGVQFCYNTPLGESLTLDDLRAQGYEAIFLAVGAHGDRKLNIPGEDAKGVVPGIAFLRALNLGETPEIGGGSSWWGAATSPWTRPLRAPFGRPGNRGLPPVAGGDARQCVGGRRGRTGGRFVSLFGLQEEILVKDGAVAGLALPGKRLGEPDAGGRRRPEAIPAPILSWRRTPSCRRRHRWSRIYGKRAFTPSAGRDDRGGKLLKTGLPTSSRGGDRKAVPPP
jgi:hypothetical protein